MIPATVWEKGRPGAAGWRRLPFAAKIPLLLALFLTFAGLSLIVQTMDCDVPHLPAGFSLLTDGFREALDGRGRAFGLAGIRALLADVAQQVRAEIFAHLCRCTEQKAGAPDDPTALRVRRLASRLPGARTGLLLEWPSRRGNDLPCG